DTYMKLIGTPYLKLVLEKWIKKIFFSKKDCEVSEKESNSVQVNPTKLEHPDDAKKNMKRLLKWVNRISADIFESLDHCPREFRQLFHYMQTKVKETYNPEQVQVTKVRTSEPNNSTLLSVVSSF